MFLYQVFMVLRWGHLRSRASPFYLKIKTRGTSDVSEIYWILKTRGSRMRECDSQGAREISLPRPRTLAISSLAVFKRSKFQTRLEFSCENLAGFFVISSAL